MVEFGTIEPVIETKKKTAWTGRNISITALGDDTF